jgi:hypothetical protein
VLYEFEGGGGMDWIGLTQDRDMWWVLVNTDEPSGSVKCRKLFE